MPCGHHSCVETKGEKTEFTPPRSLAFTEGEKYTFVKVTGNTRQCNKHQGNRTGNKCYNCSEREVGIKSSWE